MNDPLLGHRCRRELVPGQGDWYVVKMEAMGAPTSPEITQADLVRDVRAESCDP